VSRPATLAALAEAAAALDNQSVATLAHRHGLALPVSARRGKGFVGVLMERVLGADGGSLPRPDFNALGVELKTVPVNAERRPRESTYVCVAPTGASHPPRFEDSLVCMKLRRVLFVPVQTTPDHSLGESVVRQAVLWEADRASLDRIARD
jgi:DNA mismatch repair protein MutH